MGLYQYDSTPNSTRGKVMGHAACAKTLGHVKRIHLLPYHRLGQDKYEGLGRKYQMADFVPPKDEYMEQLLRAAEETSGLECQIGG